MKKLCDELMPALKQLKSEGKQVYTYTCRSCDEVASLYWFENGRVLNIQPSSWRNSTYAPDRFSLSVSYIPSQKNGSGCGLTQEDHDLGVSGASILQYRALPTWVKGITNYKSIDQFVKRDTVLEWYELDENGQRA